MKITHLKLHYFMKTMIALVFTHATKARALANEAQWHTSLGPDCQTNQAKLPLH